MSAVLGRWGYREGEQVGVGGGSGTWRRLKQLASFAHMSREGICICTRPPIRTEYIRGIILRTICWMLPS